MLVPEYKMVECAECCGEGYDLDTFYEQDGLEEDCWQCGGDGTVPQDQGLTNNSTEHILYT